MIDSHAHLTMFADDERAGIVERARLAGVARILVPATGPDDLDVVAEVPARFPGLVVAIGVHPHEARHLDAGTRGRLAAAASGPGVVAIGEIGLDYHYDHSPREEQREAFEWQLGLARELSLPVVLHHREAWDDFLASLDRFPGITGVAHSFTEGAEGALAVVARGLHVGISGMVTFGRAENVRSACSAVPAGRLLVETDSPYLAPVPHRGARNEPALVTLIAAAAATLRGVTVSELERETDEAFNRLFLGA
jgi:TatD DNase family protein